jgi:TolB protein
MKKDFFKIFVKLFLFFMVTIVSSPAFAILELELTQGSDNAYPIAISASDTSGGKENVFAIVSKDLQNSGRFQVTEDLTTTGQLDFNFSYWKDRKINAAAKGEVTKKTNGLEVSLVLYDIYNKNQLLKQSFKANEASLHALGHHISDLIYQQLTGERGIFSTKICYVSVNRAPNQLPKYSLIVSDYDGNNPHALLVSNQPIMSPVWSPNGKEIAYVSFEGNRASIYAQNIFSATRKLLSNHPGINNAPAWSPDGNKLALVLSDTGYPKIYLLNLANNNLTQLTDGWSLDTEPSWSKDGKTLIFTSNRSGSPQIYRYDFSSKKIERITYDGNYNARASFTADGKNIVLLHQQGDMFNIAIQDLSSGHLLVLTKTGYDESPSIAPNGKMIVYATNYNNKGILALVSTDGRVKLLFPSKDGGEVQEPAWGP